MSKRLDVGRVSAAVLRFHVEQAARTRHSLSSCDAEYYTSNRARKPDSIVPELTQRKFPHDAPLSCSGCAKQRTRHTIVGDRSYSRCVLEACLQVRAHEVEH